MIDGNKILANSLEDLYLSITKPTKSPELQSLHSYIKSCSKFKEAGDLDDSIQSFILKISEKNLDPSKFTYRILKAVARDTTNKDGVRYFDCDTKDGKYKVIEKKRILKTEAIPDGFDKESNDKNPLDALADKEDLEYLTNRYKNKNLTNQLEQDYISFMSGRVSERYATSRERIEIEQYRDYKKRLSELPSTIDDIKPSYPIVFFGNDYPELDYINPETKRYIRSDGKPVNPKTNERTYMGRYKGWEWYRRKKGK
jgi:hypothetical protein